MELAMEKKKAKETVSPPNQTGIPTQMKLDFESRSGLSFDDVRVHYGSDKPAQLGALAYTQGRHVYVGPGQERHLPHELGHVVQQKQGIVRPTGTLGGLPVNMSAEMEAQADHVLQKKAASSGGNVVQMLKFYEEAEVNALHDLYDKEKETPIPDHSASGPTRERPEGEPGVANSRDVVDDMISALNRKARAGRGGLAADTRADLLDTTYDTVWENAILDLHQLYEENLQLAIEEDPLWLDELSKIARFIDRNLKFISLGDMSKDSREPEQLRNKQLEELKKYLEDRGLNYDRTIQYLKTNGWNINSLGVTGEQAAALRQIKTLVTQYPYFGGSVEYEKEARTYESLIYHLSTLTRDPSRYYTDPNSSQLLKPFKDYITHEDGFVPFQNQMNLAASITECGWGELPQNLQEKIITGIGRLVKQLGGSGNPELDHLYDEWKSTVTPSLFHRLDTDQREASFSKHLWDTKTEAFKMHIYGDILQIPWSQLADPNLPNVIGLRGNIMYTPEAASRLYESKLKYKFGPTIGAGVFPDVRGAATPAGLAQNFSEKHREWYDYVRAHQLPIIGGISGHTLGYLNLYRSAREERLNKGQEKETPPSMERMRFLMMGALIGNKRHHSYDEVMAASHMMPDGMDAAKLIYAARVSRSLIHPYSDVLYSEDPGIRKTARTALERTLLLIKHNPTKSTLHVVFKMNQRVNGTDPGRQGLTRQRIYEGCFDVLVKNDPGQLKAVVEELVRTYQSSIMGTKSFDKDIAKPDWASPHIVPPPKKV